MVDPRHYTVGEPRIHYSDHGAHGHGLAIRAATAWRASSVAPLQGSLAARTSPRAMPSVAGCGSGEELGINSNELANAQWPLLRDCASGACSTFFKGG